jgi:hypothetical protein
MSGLQETDPYWKLRPEGPTPPDEVCRCPGSPPIVLQDHLSSLPLACLRCNGEVPPERLGFPADLAEKVAFWRSFHRALYTLWLDSGEYEAWAREQLERKDAPVNVRGLGVVEQLNKYRRTYYWWFQGKNDLDFVSRPSCPRCGQDLLRVFDRELCEPCSIVLAQE